MVYTPRRAINTVIENMPCKDRKFEARVYISSPIYRAPLYPDRDHSIVFSILSYSK